MPIVLLPSLTKGWEKISTVIDKLSVTVHEQVSVIGSEECSYAAPPLYFGVQNMNLH